MTPPKLEAGFVRMPEDEFEAMLARAAPWPTSVLTAPKPPSIFMISARCLKVCVWRAAPPGRPSSAL